MSDKQNYTWEELKGFCNTLSEEQLKSLVIWLGDGRGNKVSHADFFEEDQIDPYGEGVANISDYKEDEDIDLANEPVLYKKGTPVLWSNDWEK
jgi:hypothetical protein